MLREDKEVATQGIKPLKAVSKYNSQYHFQDVFEIVDLTVLELVLIAVVKFQLDNVIHNHISFGFHVAYIILFCALQFILIHPLDHVQVHVQGQVHNTEPDKVQVVQAQAQTIVELSERV